MPPQNKQSCADVGGGTDESVKQHDKNWTIKKGEQYRRAKNKAQVSKAKAKLKKSKLVSKQPYESTNQEIRGAKIYWYFRTLVFFMLGVCFVSVFYLLSFYLCDYILLKYTRYQGIFHTNTALTCFFPFFSSNSFSYSYQLVTTSSTLVKISVMDLE